MGRISAVSVQQYVVNQCRVDGHESHGSLTYINTGGRITSAVRGKAVARHNRFERRLVKLSHVASVFYFE